MKTYFYGWYFKCQSKDKSIAFIPAYHYSKNQKSSSIQIITDNNSYYVPFSYEDMFLDKKNFIMNIGENKFSSNGLEINIKTDDICISGKITFGEFANIEYDIMGPFKFVPFMQCRHSVKSMYHTLNGELNVNGEIYTFNNDLGYIEGDRGYSFPKVYSWTNCIFDNGSIMLSVADIPFGLIHFYGIIGFVYLNNKEYRIATYTGAKLIKAKNKEVIVKNSKYTLLCKLVEENSHPLAAPQNGEMVRTIRENLTCKTQYIFKEKDVTLLSIISDKASFEFEL